MKKILFLLLLSPIISFSQKKPLDHTVYDSWQRIDEKLISANGKFVAFTTYETHIGFHLATFEEAINFNNYHEGIHLGFMMNIRKFV